MSDPDVAIVGVGLHPFGRYPGKSAMEMGEDAVYEALTDAGVKWEDIQALYAGSMEVKNPEGIVGLLGQTGVPGRAVFTGCATGATSLAMAANAIRLGDADIAIAIGLDKHPRGAFSDDPSVSGLPLWYGQAGLFLTTHFFGMKINRYMHDHGITSATLAKVAAKAFRNGAQTHHAWRRKPLTEDEILGSQVLNYPLTQYMYCGPNEGAAAAVLVRADQAHQYTDTPVYHQGEHAAQPPRGRVRAAQPVLRPRHRAGPTVEASREAYELAGIGPEDVDLAQLQDTDAGLRGHPHGGERPVRARRAGEAARRGRHRDHREDPGQHRRRAARQRRAGRGLGAAPGLRARQPAQGPGRRTAGPKDAASGTPSSMAPRAPRPSRSSRGDGWTPQRSTPQPSAAGWTRRNCRARAPRP